jgi:Gamma-glutamyl cyclotransferase, AIG2-like
LTPADIARLDAFEGEVLLSPSKLIQEYERRDVDVTMMDGEVLSAATYIWIAEEDRLAKEEWNFEEFVREKLGRWTGRSEEFRESDEVATGGRSIWDGDVVRSAV